MTMQTQFWLALGFMAGLATAFFVLRLWQTQALRLLNVWTATALLVFVAGSVWIYSKVGKPETVPAAAASAWPQLGTAAQGPAAANQQAGSMMEAIQRLSAKLAREANANDPTHDADWQLLAQSYRFVGDEASAVMADKHQLPVVPAMASPMSSPMASIAVSPATSTDAQVATTPAVRTGLQALQQQVKANPRDVAGWRALAEALRTARQFDQSLAAYAELIKLKGMDADAWADYADAAGSKTGSLANAKTNDALTRALQLDAKHPKALWLMASLQLEEKHYAQALKTWQQLRTVIPDNSPDARIIDANIDEARTLSTGKPMLSGDKAVAPAAAQVAPASEVRITGQINADARVVAKGKTLFVFAKSADSPAPVAVWRMTVDRWPVAFTLDDSSAMMPTRKLSMFPQVQVQARLSQSGQALAQPGDWQSDVQTVSTGTGKAIVLTINRPVS